jgi:hypothetical protein
VGVALSGTVAVRRIGVVDHLRRRYAVEEADNGFEFGPRAILDGLEAQVTARRTPAGQNARKPPRHGQEPLGGPGLAS